MHRNIVVAAALAVATMLFSGCPKPIDIKELQIEKLELSSPSGTRYCVERPPQLVVTITDNEQKTYRTWKPGEGTGGKLLFEDFQFETNMGRIDEKGYIVIDNPLETLKQELVIKVRPNAPTGQGTKIGDWIKDELRLTPAYDCSTSLVADGMGGRGGTQGAGGRDGDDGADGSGDPNCASGQNGTNGQDGSNGGNGESGGHAPDLRIHLAMAASAWCDKVAVARVEIAGEGTWYRIIDPVILDKFVVAAIGGNAGNGGSGGRGGRGGDGGDARCKSAVPGNGGNGGRGGGGGSGGDGGNGGRIEVFAADNHPELATSIVYRNEGGQAGAAGYAGSGGNGGRAGSTSGSTSGFPGKDGVGGGNGSNGRNGAPGPAVMVHTGNAAEYFATEIQAGLELQ